MPRPSTKSRRATTIASVVAVLACLGVAACGSSSGGSSSSVSTPTAVKTTAEAVATTQTTTAPESTTPTTTTPTSTTHEPTITTRKQFVALFDCLRHNGIKLPPINELGGKHTINTNTPQFKAARTKCLHTVFGGG
jgi:uncharacterized protein YggE